MVNNFEELCYEILEKYLKRASSKINDADLFLNILKKIISAYYNDYYNSVKILKII